MEGAAQPSTPSRFSSSFPSLPSIPTMPHSPQTYANAPGLPLPPALALQQAADCVNAGRCLGIASVFPQSMLVEENSCPSLIPPPPPLITFKGRSAMAPAAKKSVRARGVEG